MSTIVSKRRLIGITMSLAALGVPAAVSAQGIAFTARGGNLQRHSLATGSTTTVGPIGSDVVALAFAPGGQLWGTEEGGRLVAIDDATGAGVPGADPFGPASGFAVSDVTFDPAGTLWAVGSEDGGTVLYEIDVAGGSATLVGTLSEPVSAIADLDGTLYGLADSELFTIDTSDGSLTPADGFFLDALAMDFSAAGDLWLLGSVPVAPPIDFLAGFDLEFGEEVAAPIEIPSGTRGLAIEPAGPCVPTGTEMCLLGRFRAEVTWRGFQGGTGAGGVVPEDSDRSGLFYFFNADNWEMLIKVLDGCSVNGHFWVFAAQATNVEYTLTVTDTQSGVSQTYVNPLGVTPLPVTDTAAFETCP